MRRTSVAGVWVLLLVIAQSGASRADGFGPTVTKIGSGFGAAGAPTLVGDFNGDGITDIVKFVKDSQPEPARGDVIVSLGPTFATTAVWHSFFCIGTEIPVVGDWNGDGKDDIGLFKRNASGDQTGDVLVALSTGASFGATQIWQDFFGVNDEIPAVGDFNGDGKTDIAVFKPTGPQAGDVLVALSTGSSFNAASNLWKSNFAVGTQLPLVGDFNGDGKSDIAMFRRSDGSGLDGQVVVALSTGTAFGATTQWHAHLALGSEIPVIGDFNDDGKSDVAVFKLGNDANNPGDVLVALSTGAQFSFPQLGSPPLPLNVWHNTFGVSGDAPAIGDFNGDGLTDLLLFRPNGGVVVALNADPSPAHSALRAQFGYDRLNVGRTKAAGTRPLVVVLTDFSDFPMRSAHNVTYYRNMIHTGSKSVNGWFRENSFNAFGWSNAGVVGPFRFPDNPNTPVNESKRECAKGNTSLCPGTTMTEEAEWAQILQIASSSLNLRSLDTNHNGILEPGEAAIVFVMASASGDLAAIERHLDSSITDATGTLLVSTEIVSITEGAGLNFYVHELSHTLGAVDLYGHDPGGFPNSAFATQMSIEYGPEDTLNVVELDAWHKIALGWVQPRIFDITEPGNCQYLKVSPADGVVESALVTEQPLVFYDPRRPVNEFFMMEYRMNGSGNQYDNLATATGIASWYVQLNGDHVPTGLAGRGMFWGPNGVLDTLTPAFGSDDALTGGNMTWGPDEVWQTLPAGDDSYNTDFGVFLLPYDNRRGASVFYPAGTLTAPTPQVRTRYLRRTQDAELVFQVAKTSDPTIVAVKWGHNTLDIEPRLVPSDILGCYALFP